jgi:carboxymethylenebutenolidase
MQTLTASFPRGKCAIDAFGPLEDKAAPIILMYPDAFGRRPATHAVAMVLAAEGWRVLMPELFYDHVPYHPIEPKSIFEQGPKHDALMALFRSVNQETIDADTSALLDFAATLGPDAPIAATGYCMGGRYALTTACASPRVRFAATLHSSNLAPEGQDGAHRRFASAQGRLYIGVAGIDPSYGAEEHGRLAQALREAGTDHVIETYHNAAHGWVFPDIPIYDEGAAAKHMQRLKDNMWEVFA